MGAAWEVTPQKVKAVVDKIVEVARPRKVILFGSYVRGDMTVNSDLDVMVVESRVEDPRKESVRIRRALRGILMPMDILVVQEDVLSETADIPGLIYREAIKTGKVVYESAS
jgi:predicted nucleotidyltransferase